MPSRTTQQGPGHAAAASTWGGSALRHAAVALSGHSHAWEETHEELLSFFRPPFSPSSPLSFTCTDPMNLIHLPISQGRRNNVPNLQASRRQKNTAQTTSVTSNQVCYVKPILTSSITTQPLFLTLRKFGGASFKCLHDPESEGKERWTAGVPHVHLTTNSSHAQESPLCIAFVFSHLIRPKLRRLTSRLVLFPPTGALSDNHAHTVCSQVSVSKIKLE
ncbi:hypothetical protein E2C01_005582 [Portunus trituberculatus]|uniref:Uncharacterized protein n=1 Tax=Portunus trituberculatus TaxID=210409 RepID=A0A5B7CST0_PORTR|nr:hypothetical protein [Portunus trituberculatus]